MSAAHGGQVLLSQAVVDLVRERLPEAVSLRDLGLVRLRDLASPERLYQVLHPALRQDFPALRSLEAAPNNLPQQVTSFVGREHELDEARKALARTRLLTFLGAGGIGKTRLSLQVAAEALDDYPDGAWFVELAPIADPRLVPQVVASTLGVKEDASASIADALVAHLADKTSLVVLDNCEHLLDACARLADRLLRDAPKVKLMASSREPLHIAGETVYPVPALAVPDPGKRAGRLRHRHLSVRAAVPRARDVGVAVVPDHRCECSHGCGDLPASGRHTARDRARRCARAGDAAGRDRHPPARSLPPADRRQPDGAAAAADAAGADRLEP